MNPHSLLTFNKQRNKSIDVSDLWERPWLKVLWFMPSLSSWSFLLRNKECLKVVSFFNRTNNRSIHTDVMASVKVTPSVQVKTTFHSLSPNHLLLKSSTCVVLLGGHSRNTICSCVISVKQRHSKQFSQVPVEDRFSAVRTYSPKIFADNSPCQTLERFSSSFLISKWFHNVFLKW